MDDQPTTVATYDGPFPTKEGPIDSIDVVEIDSELYDLYDNDCGECLNTGCPFPFLPTQEEVAEFVLTGKVKGKIE